jgi:hypothetical protein
MMLCGGCGRTNGSPCTTNADCASDNCINRNPDGGAGVCCVAGGCP